MHRNIWILSACQALLMAGPPLVILSGGLVGTRLAPSEALRTLPIGSMVLGAAFAAIPAALFMKKVGRKVGFLFGAAVMTKAITA